MATTMQNDHHGFSFAQFKSALSGVVEVNSVQHALMLNMVRASGSPERAFERDRERTAAQGAKR